MLKTLTKYLFVAALTAATNNIFADNQDNQLLAFPGAEGYGKYVTGGRGGEVCYVTRLDDCSDNNLVPGTLRWALRHDNGGKPRTVLFATSGTIYLTSKLKLQYPDVSILGQTAPGGGVCIAGYNMYICKDNVIVRYVRFRAGDVPNSSMTGLDIENCKGVILDHCSMTWSMEECLTAYDTDNTTVQWCIIGEGLYNSKNSKGARAYAMQWGGEHSTMHHTLITNSHSRSPRFNGVRSKSNKKGEHDYQVDSEFANNVIFNWSSTGAIYGGEYAKSTVEVPGSWTDNDPGYDRVYMINNYFRPGPSTKVGKTETYFASPSSPFGEWYLDGNKFEESGTYAPWTAAQAQAANADNTKAAKGLSQTNLLTSVPYALSGMQYESAEACFTSVTTKAGASLPRYDAVDRRLLDEAAGKVASKYVGTSLKGSGDYGIIDSPSDIHIQNYGEFVAKLDGNAGYEVQRNYPNLSEGAGYVLDSDCDGMPDGYEDSVGLNKNNAADGAQVAANGYTNLENYLNGVAAGTIDKCRYESEVYVMPGEEISSGGEYTVTIDFDSTIEGVAPVVTSIPMASATIPDNLTFYKEGYTFECWVGDDGNYYYAYQNCTLTRNLKLTPLFRKNTKSIDGHTTTLNLTWFLPNDISEEKGLSVSRNYVEGEWIDTKIAYDHGKVTLPWGKGASVKVDSMFGIEVPGEEPTATIEVGYDKATDTHYEPHTLDLILPVVQEASGAVSAVWAQKGSSDKNAIQAPGGVFATATATVGANLTEGAKASGGINYWTFSPTNKAKSEANMVEFTLTPADGVVFKPMSISLNAMRFGTDGGKWDVSYVADGKEVSLAAGLSANRDNSGLGPSKWSYDLAGFDKTAKSFKVRVYIYDNTGKTFGINDLTVSGEYEGTAAPVVPCVFSVNVDKIGGTVKWEPEGTVFPAGTKVTLTATEDKGYLFSLGGLSMINDDYNDGLATKYEFTLDHNMFLNAEWIDAKDWAESLRQGSYDAVCSSPWQLLTALKLAEMSDKERFLIFVEDGQYELSNRVKNNIPANTSIIGQSREGVVISNHPTTVSNYQEDTPVFFIDQNQNDVYMENLTVRQGRDWETKTSTGQAIAVRQRGKRAIYNNVALQGVQDTYYLNKADATAYFENSALAGEVDFIYGDGTMWFENCVIQPVSAKAVITASNAQPGYKGIVFNNSTIEAEPSAKGDVKGYFLGRPWNDSPAVTYLNTTMKALPADAGWTGMKSGLTVRFHEYGSKDADGNVLDLSKRSIAACGAAAGSDSPVLTETQAAEYTLASVFGDWNPKAKIEHLQMSQAYYDEDKDVAFWAPVEGAIGYVLLSKYGCMAYTDCYSDGVMGSVEENVVCAVNRMGGLSAPVTLLPGKYASIESVNVPVNAKNGNVAYNIIGQRVDDKAKGIVIINGKKFLNK